MFAIFVLCFGYCLLYFCCFLLYFCRSINQTYMKDVSEQSTADLAFCSVQPPTPKSHRPRPRTYCVYMLLVDSIRQMHKSCIESFITAHVCLLDSLPPFACDNESCMNIERVSLYVETIEHVMDTMS